MTKQGNKAHEFLKIIDSTGITLFMYPFNLINHCPNNYRAHSYSPFHFLLKGYYIITNFIIVCAQPNPLVLGVFCVKIRLNYSAETSRIPSKLRISLGIFAATGYCCSIEQQKLVSIYNASWMSLLLFIRIFFLFSLSQTFPEFLWSSPLGPF